MEFVAGEDFGGQCQRTVAGGVWRCSNTARSDHFLCEEHYLVVQQAYAARGENQGRPGGNNKGKDKVFEGNDGGFGSEGSKRRRGVEVDSEGGRKRGRPKGSKSKVGETSQRGGAKGSSVGRKRGRPEANDSEGVSVRKRGRPVGSKTKEIVGGSGREGPNGSDNGAREKGKLENNKKKQVVAGIERPRIKGLSNGDKNGEGSGCEVEATPVASRTVEKVIGGIESSERGTRMEGLRNRGKNGEGCEVEATPVARRAGHKVVGMKKVNRGKGLNEDASAERVNKSNGDAGTGVLSKKKKKVQFVNGDSIYGNGRNIKDGVVRNTVNATDKTDVATSADPVVPRRGRPKGSKNKKNQIHVNQVDEPSDSEESIPDVVGDFLADDDKIEGSSKSKSGQGRPKDSKNKKKSLEVETNGQPRLDVNETCDFACEGERIRDGNAEKYKSSISGISVDDKQSKQTRLVCHQCLKSNKDGSVICSNCTRKCYCYECIEKWYPKRTKQDIEMLCPFCCGNCNCKSCLQADVHNPHRGLPSGSR